MGATRRTLLIAGGAAAAVTLAAGARWAATRTPEAALAPWDHAGESLGDKRLDAAAFAVLAPSAHNMQPWLIRLETDPDVLTLICDPDRLLPEIDPNGRQTVIGLGGFLELLRMAAAEAGWRLEIDPFPDGEPPGGLVGARRIATVRFREDNAVPRDPLIHASTLRRTDRSLYETGTKPARNALESLRRAPGPDVDVHASDAPEVNRRLRAITRDAWAVEWGLARTRRESLSVMRVGRRAIEARPWGLALSGPGIEAAAAAGLVSPEAMDRPGSTAFRQGLDSYAPAWESAPAHLWITTPRGSRRAELIAGRAWLRVHLEATRLGLAVQPVSQALQEFPEMAELYAAVHATLGARAGETVQMLARVGVPRAAPPPAPRQPVIARMVTL